jgi:hypothetical protein
MRHLYYPCFLLCLLFTCAVAATAQTLGCCDKLRQAGIESYNKGDYADAIKKWEAAKTCATKCKTDDLDAKIKEARAKLNPPTKTDSPSNLKAGDCCYIRGSSLGFSLRQRKLTVVEVATINECRRCEECWTDACEKINNETYISSVEYGEKVTFLKKESKWYLIKQNSTGYKGWISAVFAGVNALEKCK